ncbi:MAG: hypothetical protein DDT20_01701 [Firmicutes bacterium]|nr:hypothetical protein [Bacillota bacterium]
MRFRATDKGNVQFTAEEELERDREEAAWAVAQTAVRKAAANAIIQAQLDAADLKIIRALTEGDTVRIAAHVTAQAALRAKLK